MCYPPSCCPTYPGLLIAISCRRPSPNPPAALIPLRSLLTLLHSCCALLQERESHLLLFQPLAHSLRKTPGVSRRALSNSAFPFWNCSAPQDEALRTLRKGYSYSVRPPSTTSTWPVTNPALTKYATAPATSSGRPERAKGARRMKSASHSA